jgi:large subunit ribosomal protein L18
MKFEKRAKRIRFNLLSKSKDRIRLCVFRSSNHTSIQAIDDSKGLTIASSSTCSSAFKESFSSKSVSAAEWVGKQLGAKLLELQQTRVFFDRGGYKYHGRVKALADGVRSMGLDF